MNTGIEKIFQEQETLTREQETFQRKVKAIEKLKEELASLTEELKKAAVEFEKVAAPLKRESFKLFKERVVLLGELYLNPSKKMSRTVMDNLKDIIQCECEKMLMYDNDPEVRKVYEECIGEGQVQGDGSKEEGEGPAFEEFFADFDFNNEGEFNTHSEEDPKAAHRQKQREAKEAAKADAKKRSVKEIYRDLIKVYHPDKEMDETKKMEKEEISKELTEAYKKDDLLALLKYELQLLETSEDRIKELAKSKLKIYNEVLNDQKSKLEADLHMLKLKNELVYRNMCVRNANRKKFLSEVVKDFRQQVVGIEYDISMLKSDPSYLKVFVWNYLHG